VPIPRNTTRITVAACVLGVLAGCATTSAQALPDDAIGVGALAAQCDSPVQVQPSPTPVPSAQPPGQATPPADGFYRPGDAVPPGLLSAGYTVLWYLPGAPSGVLATLRTLVTYLRRRDGFTKVVAAPGDPTMFRSRKNLVLDRMLGPIEVQQPCGQVAQNVVLRFMEMGVPSAAPADTAPGTSA